MVKKVSTPVFRVSFPVLAEAKAMEGQPGAKAKFSVCAVWEPSKFTPKEKELWLAMQALGDEASMEKFKKKLDQLPGNFKKPFRDGAEKEDLMGFGPGKIFSNLSSLMRPGVIDRDRNPITDYDGEVYPGCFARATITCYAYDVSGGRGVAFGLQNLQKVKDGDRLDSRTDAADDFGDDLEDMRDEEDPLA